MYGQTIYLYGLVMGYFDFDSSGNFKNTSSLFIFMNNSQAQTGGLYNYTYYVYFMSYGYMPSLSGYKGYADNSNNGIRLKIWDTVVNKTTTYKPYSYIRIQITTKSGDIFANATLYYYGGLYAGISISGSETNKYYVTQWTGGEWYEYSYYRLYTPEYYAYTAPKYYYNAIRTQNEVYQYTPAIRYTKLQYRYNELD